MDTTISEKYVKGFNQSYLLAKYKPQLIEQLLQTTTENEYIQTMRDGKRAFEQGKVKDLSNRKMRLQELESLKESKNRDRGLER